MTDSVASTAPGPTNLESAVLDVVRELAFELSGDRARHAATARASLERDLGLGSIERVELLARLERRFGRTLDDSVLAIDTPAELARALEQVGARPPDRSSGPDSATGVLAAPATVTAATIHGMLWRRAEREPHRPHVFMREEDGSEHTVSYGQLLSEARAVAGGLAERGIARGDTVALMLPTGLDFLRSFQGILIAGAVPVPIYPPVRLDRLEEYAQRQTGILADAGVKLLITIPKARPVVSVLRAGVASLRHVVSAEELSASRPWSTLAGAGADSAFIQYTSGSTGQPKGVLLTHHNLLANIRAITRGLDAQPTDVGVSWLPLYHDMGLIGSWLFCMCAGIPIDIQSPLAFLSRPERWLWSIHRRRGTLSGAPNFAYELCVRRIADAAIEGLDLSSWRCALNGAEPIRPDTLERFVQRFAKYGFRREAMMPVYGLAENSVALCFPPPGRGPHIDRVARAAFESAQRAEPASPGDATALEFVSEGAALAEHEVRVVDDTGEVVPERSVGRLVFRGPSMMAGYYNKPDATAAATLPGGWLDSGDLAYVAGGEIHVTGRRKDLIIKGGRNIVPQEVEAIAQEVSGIRKGCVAAFGVSSATLGTEQLVVVAETRTAGGAERDALVAAVIDRVTSGIGVPPDQVVLVPPGAVPKTSSGKIRRSGAKEAYLGGRLGARQPLRLAHWLRLGRSAVADAVTRRLERVVRIAYAVYLACAIGIGVLAAWPIVGLLRKRSAVRRLERCCIRYALFVMGCRLERDGSMPAGAGPYLIASNHTSYLDIPALLALLPIEFVFLAKKEAADWPFVGTFIRKGGHLTVDRADAADSVATASKMAAALERKQSVLVFPEATFTAASGLRPFKLGVFKTASNTGTPVVPVALTGVRRVLRDGSWIPRPGPIRLWIGGPIAARGDDWHAVVALRDAVADAIGARCGEPRLDLLAAGPESSR